MKCCPFNEETALSDIVDGEDAAQQIDLKVKAFQKTLNPEQLAAFKEIDDLYAQFVTSVQHATLKKIHCVTCKKRTTGCP